MLRISSRQPSAFTIFESTLWFYHEFMSTPKAFFQQVFALHKLYCTLFYTSYKYLHITRCLFFSIVFSLTLLSDFKLLKRIIFIYIIFSFLSKSECRPPIKAVSQILCLERLQSQTHFLRFETKLSQFFFFFTVSRITYYFPIISGILFTWRQCEVAVSCHYFLNRTTIHFPLKDLWLKYYREK